MSEHCVFYIKRHDQPNGARSATNAQPNDLPPKAPSETPKIPHDRPDDLPLPRHRPGEPLMYDPPAHNVETFPITDPERSHIQ